MWWLLCWLGLHDWDLNRYSGLGAFDPHLWCRQCETSRGYDKGNAKRQR